MACIYIILLSVAAAVLYAVLHDQVTARVCVEYFTIGHTPLIDTQDPTLLALDVGTRSSWWFGLALGILLALAARAGRLPQLAPLDLVRPLLVLLAVTAVCSLLAGIVGFFLARSGGVRLIEPLATLVPVDRHVVFLTDLWAHSAAYAAGGVGGAVLIGLTLRKRWRRRQRSLPPATE